MQHRRLNKAMTINTIGAELLFVMPCNSARSEGLYHCRVFITAPRLCRIH